MAEPSRASARRRSVAPVVVWLGHVGLPLAGLWLLIAQPALDVHWEDHGAHFVLVLAAGAVSVHLALRVGEQARSQSDARLFVVSLALLTAAGFLGLHGLATPGVLVDARTLGFVAASPVGLLLAGVLALASSLDPGPGVAALVLAKRRALHSGLVAALLGWLLISLLAAAAPILTALVVAALPWLALLGAALYAVAAVRYFAVHRRRPAAVLISVVSAFVLLGEAMIAIAVAPAWALSWWLWHVLMVLAFGLVAYTAQVQQGREGSRSRLFAGIALDETVAEIRRDHAVALEELVELMSDGRDPDWPRMRDRLAARFDLTERQLDVLQRGAAAVADERDQIRRLGALVAVGQRVRVIAGEDELLADAQRLVSGAFGAGAVRLAVRRGGTLAFTDGLGPPTEVQLELPLTVKGREVGVLAANAPGREFADRDVAVLRALASQLSVALENTRLYQQLDGLFRSYLSPEVATALVADPEQAALGGAVVEVTVLMADLTGFTPFAERAAPADVVAMLNTYYDAVVPCVLAEGGTVVQFVGDAVMAIFGAPVRHGDHAARAVRAALALQAAAGRVARPGWPRFRAGVNSGPALVGNIGSAAMRNYTAIGDTTNLAARLQAAAPPDGVVVSAATRAVLDAPGADLDWEPLGDLRVKGRIEPVAAYRASPAPPGPPSSSSRPHVPRDCSTA